MDALAGRKRFEEELKVWKLVHEGGISESLETYYNHISYMYKNLRVSRCIN